MQGKLLRASRATTVSTRHKFTSTTSITARHCSRQVAVRTMAFQTSRNEGMMQTAKKYVAAWQSPAGSRDALTSCLAGITAPSGIKYIADGIVHLEDRTKSAEELADHILERHKAYKHVVHDVFGSAVDEETNSVYIGIRFVMQCVGPVAGKDPTGWPSQGVLIERLVLDNENRIQEALVCRQMTREEAGALTVDPSALKPPPLDDTILYAPEEKLSDKDLEAMSHAVVRWVHCWDSETDNGVEDLNKILDPNVKQLAGYGLGRRSVPFSGIPGACHAIEGALSKMHNTNTLLSKAICTDRRAGFVHWQANMLPVGANAPQTIQGLDYLRFSPENKISAIWSFTMQPYSNVRDNAPRGAGVD